MAFQKGNQLWKKGLPARKERQEKIESFFAIAASGGIERYGMLLDVLSNGQKLSTPQKEFMDRFEKLFPYMKAKRTDITSGGEKIIPQPIMPINVPSDDSDKKDSKPKKKN